MKHIRKLLSLLLVLVMVCSLFTVASAAEITSDDIDWTVTASNANSALLCTLRGGHTPVRQYSNNYYYYYCSVCGATGTLKTAGNNYYGHNHQYSAYNDSYHSVSCSVSSCKYATGYYLEEHNGTSYCTLCGWYNGTAAASDITWAKSSSCYASSNPTYTHSPVYSYHDGTYAHYYCSYCGESGTVRDVISGTGSSGTTNSNVYWDSSYCYSNYSYNHTHTPAYNYSDGTYDYYSCSNYGCSATGWALKGSSTTSTGLVLNPSSNLIGDTTYQENASNIYVEVTPKVYSTLGYDVTSSYTISYEWSGDYKTAPGNTYYAAVDTSKESCKITVKVTAVNKTDSTDKFEETYTWNASVGGVISASATVYNTTTGYALGDADDNAGTSVEQQIAAAISNLSSSYYTTCTLDHVTFSSVRANGGTLSATAGSEYYYNSTYSTLRDLGDVVFTPTANYEGEVAFNFTAYYYESAYNYNYNYNYNNGTLKAVAGTLLFNVKKGGEGIGIVYSALSGASVTLDVSDFAEFWAEQYPYGTLESVTFNTLSTAKGKLYDASGKQISRACYYNPTTSQTSLTGVTFVPNNTNVTSVEIGFTARGTKSYSGSSYSNSATATGKITILYTAREVTAIEYKTTGSSVTLSNSDFLNKYKEVMGVSSVSNSSSLTVKFLDVPTYGTLYMNYNAGSGYYYTGTTGTALTEKTVLNYTFSGNTNASRSIDDVTFVPGAAGVAESVRYACYYGGQLMFVGTVEFGAAKPVEIEYTTTAGTPVEFAALDFYSFTSLSTSASLTGNYLYFGAPTSGALYVDYNSTTGTGTRVTINTPFTSGTYSYGSTYSLSSLTYVPATGYVGVIEIPFYTSSTMLTAQSAGTVKIYVGRAFTDVLGTSSAWAASYINKLSAQGIVNGTNAEKTLYSPSSSVTYGEALKLIMMAAGYPEQAKTGTHWASGYLSRAYSDGLISTTNVDLNAAITRDAIAELSAKALKLGYSYQINTGIIGPSDSTNGYVYALYNAGIVSGTLANGTSYFYGSDSINRAEISKIICKVADYEA